MNSFHTMIQQDVEHVLPEPKVLGVSGSPRNGGNSDILLRHILNGVTENQLPSDGVRLADCRFEPCIGCEKCRTHKICTGHMDGMSFLYPKIIQSKGLVLACPTHNYNITAWMKAFIDRLYCFYNFAKERPGPWSSRLSGQGRKALIAGVCEQASEKDMGFTMEAMRMPLEAMGYEVVGELAVLGTFHKAGVKKQNNTLKDAETMGRNLARSLSR